MVTHPVPEQVAKIGRATVATQVLPAMRLLRRTRLVAVTGNNPHRLARAVPCSRPGSGSVLALRYLAVSVSLMLACRFGPDSPAMSESICGGQQGRRPYRLSVTEKWPDEAATRYTAQRDFSPYNRSVVVTEKISTASLGRL